MPRVRVTDYHVDASTGDRRRAGDIVEVSEDKAARLIDADLAVPHRREVQTATADETDIEERSEAWRQDYRTAQKKVKDLGLNVKANAPHDVLIEAIEEAT